jgi:thiamine biosynthesis lipoprotein ApbE
MPVADAASVSVLAPDAMAADFVATIVGVLGPVDGLAFADALDDRIGVCLIDARGRLFRNERWRGVECQG